MPSKKNCDVRKIVGAHMREVSSTRVKPWKRPLKKKFRKLKIRNIVMTIKKFLCSDELCRVKLQMKKDPGTYVTYSVIQFKEKVLYSRLRSDYSSILHGVYSKEALLNRFDKSSKRILLNNYYTVSNYPVDIGCSLFEFCNSGFSIFKQLKNSMELNSVRSVWNCLYDMEFQDPQQFQNITFEALLDCLRSSGFRYNFKRCVQLRFCERIMEFLKYNKKEKEKKEKKEKKEEGPQSWLQKKPMQLIDLANELESNMNFLMSGKRFSEVCQKLWKFRNKIRMETSTEPIELFWQLINMVQKYDIHIFKHVIYKSDELLITFYNDEELFVVYFFPYIALINPTRNILYTLGEKETNEGEIISTVKSNKCEEREPEDSYFPKMKLYFSLFLQKILKIYTVLGKSEKKELGILWNGYTLVGSIPELAYIDLKAENNELNESDLKVYFYGMTRTQVDLTYDPEEPIQILLNKKSNYDRLKKIFVKALRSIPKDPMDNIKRINFTFEEIKLNKICQSTMDLEQWLQRESNLVIPSSMVSKYYFCQTDRLKDPNQKGRRRMIVRRALELHTSTSMLAFQFLPNICKGILFYFKHFRHFRVYEHVVILSSFSDLLWDGGMQYTRKEKIQKRMKDTCANEIIEIPRATIENWRERCKIREEKFFGTRFVTLAHKKRRRLIQNNELLRKMQKNRKQLDIFFLYLLSIRFGKRYALLGLKEGDKEKKIKEEKKEKEIEEEEKKKEIKEGENKIQEKEEKEEETKCRNEEEAEEGGKEDKGEKENKEKEDEKKKEEEEEDEMEEDEEEEEEEEEERAEREERKFLQSIFEEIEDDSLKFLFKTLSSKKLEIYTFFMTVDTDKIIESKDSTICINKKQKEYETIHQLKKKCPSCDKNMKRGKSYSHFFSTIHMKYVINLFLHKLILEMKRKILFSSKSAYLNLKRYKKKILKEVEIFMEEEYDFMENVVVAFDSFISNDFDNTMQKELKKEEKEEKKEEKKGEKNEKSNQEKKEEVYEKKEEMDFYLKQKEKIELVKSLMYKTISKDQMHKNICIFLEDTSKYIERKKALEQKYITDELLFKNNFAIFKNYFEEDSRHLFDIKLNYIVHLINCSISFNVTIWDKSKTGLYKLNKIYYANIFKNELIKNKCTDEFMEKVEYILYMINTKLPLNMEFCSFGNEMPNLIRNVYIYKMEEEKIRMHDIVINIKTEDNVKEEILDVFYDVYAFVDTNKEILYMYTYHRINGVGIFDNHTIVKLLKDKIYNSISLNPE